MYKDAFIGSVDVPGFSWKKSSADNEFSAVFPKEIIDILPDSNRAFDLILNFSSSKKRVSKKLDWGTWSVRASKKEVIEFLQLLYGKDIMEKNSIYILSLKKEIEQFQTEPDTEMVSKMVKREINDMRKLVNFVKKLNPKKTYALVATET